MKLTGLISPNFSEDTLEDVYKVFPPGIRIEGRTLKVEKYTDDEFRRAERMLADLVRDLARQPLDFLMITGELFLSYKGPGSDLDIPRPGQDHHCGSRFDGADRSGTRLPGAWAQAHRHGFAVSRGSG